jgi:integrase
MLKYAQRFAPKTMQWLASALRSFFGYAFLTGLLDTDLSGAVPGVACRPAQLPKFLTPQQVQAMISTCDPATAAGARDRAMLLMLWRLGLRAGEVAGLRLDEIDWRAGEVTVTGRKNRITPLTPDTVQLLHGWLPGRPAPGSAALFTTSTGTPLSRDAFADRLAMHAAAATADCPSLGGKKTTPYVLRRRNTVAARRSGHRGHSVVARPRIAHYHRDLPQLSGIASDGRETAGRLIITGSR